MLQNQGSICHNSNNAKQEIHTKCSSLITCISYHVAVYLILEQAPELEMSIIQNINTEISPDL